MKNIEINNLFIITGGPGSGKTSIINELEQRGYNVVCEGARKIIKQQMQQDGDALPWKDVRKFHQLCLEYYINAYKQVLKNNNLTFFDCAIIELVAYNRLAKVEDSNQLLEFIKNMQFNKIVFTTPPWKEIYHKDTERRQTFEASIIIYNEIVHVYTEYGYEIVEIPKEPIQQRVDFIIDKIERLNK